MAAKKPSGYAVLEFDLQNDRWAAMLGVDIKLSDFIDDLPDWLNVITLKGDLRGRSARDALHFERETVGGVQPVMLDGVQFPIDRAELQYGGP